MKEKIIFKDKNGVDVINFENFDFPFDEYLDRVVFQVTIDIGFLKATATIETEEYDFDNMKMCLEKGKSFIFNNIEDQINMQFDLRENGLITVQVKLKNTMSTGRLEFKFETAQAFIPELIKEIDIVMRKNQ